MQYRPPAEAGVMVPATRSRLSDETFGRPTHAQTSPRREPEGSAISNLDGLEQAMINDGLVYEERRRLWNRGVTRLDIYRALRDEDLAAEGIARNERREAYKALLAVEQHTSLAEAAHEDFQQEFERFRFRQPDGSPVDEGDTEELEASLQDPVGGFSPHGWGSGGFAAAGETLDRMRLRKAELQADEQAKSRHAEKCTAQLQREREERTEQKDEIAALLGRGVGSERAKLSGCMLSQDGRQRVLHAVTSSSQLVRMDLHDMRLLGLSILDCRILDEIRIEALAFWRSYENMSSRRTPAGQARSPGGRLELRGDHSQRWEGLMQLVDQNGWDSLLPPHLEWSRENEEWVASWIESNLRKERVRDHHREWSRSPPTRGQPSPTETQPDVPRPDRTRGDRRSSSTMPSGSKLPVESPADAPDRAFNTRAGQTEAPHRDRVASARPNGPPATVPALEERKSTRPADMPDRNLDSRPSQHANRPHLIDSWKTRVNDALELSKYVTPQRLERCGGALFGGCSSCRVEGFHIKQGLCQTTKWTGGSASRQKGGCFSCGQEALRCTTEKCGAFAVCEQSGKDALKCLVCTKAIPDWERNPDDEMFDFQRAERLVEAEEESLSKSAIRSHHLNISLLDFEPAQDKKGNTHIVWKLEIRIGTQEPYVIRRRFNLFKELAKDLKAWDFKPKEIQDQVGKFTLTVPTANWVKSYTDDKNMKLRLELLGPWCTSLSRWASQLMDPKSGDAFVDYLSVCNSDAERQVMKQKVQVQAGLNPIREFFLPDDGESHSASFRNNMMRATVKSGAAEFLATGPPTRSLVVHRGRGALGDIAEGHEEAETHSEPELNPEPEPEPELELPQPAATIGTYSDAETDGEEFDHLAVTVYKSDDDKPETTVGELRQQWKREEVNGGTYIWMEDFEGWQQLASYAEQWRFEDE